MPSFNMKIILGGIPGSGKGTVAKLLAEKYNLKNYSVGGLRRDIAKSKNITIEQLNKIDEAQLDYNKTSDKLVDDFQKELSKKDNFRLCFIANFSTILLSVSPVSYLL